MSELVDLVEHHGGLLKVEDGQEEGDVEQHVERVLIGPVAYVGGRAPREHVHDVGEVVHGVRVLAHVDGADLDGMHDLTVAEHDRELPLWYSSTSANSACFSY
jgi:hypothetical protein